MKKRNKPQSETQQPQTARHISWRHTIFMKIFALMALNIAFVIVCYIALNTMLHAKYYLSKKENMLEKSFTRVESLYSDLDTDSDELSLELEKLSNDYNVQIMVIDSAENVLYSTLLENAVRFKHRPPAEPNADAGTKGERGKPPERSERTVLDKTDKYTIFSMYISALDASSLELWGDIGGGRRVLIQASVAAIRESIGISNRFWLFCGIIATLCALCIAFFLSRRMTERIKEISEVANRMSEMDFSVKYTIRGKDEISLWGESLNKMSDKLEKAVSELKRANIELTRDIDKKEKIDRQRREFLSNVSHELKTPISIIEAYAEGLNEMELDEEGRKFYTDVIVDESKKMSLLIQKLMSLMKIESGS